MRQHHPTGGHWEDDIGNQQPGPGGGGKSTSSVEEPPRVGQRLHTNRLDHHEGGEHGRHHGSGNGPVPFRDHHI